MKILITGCTGFVGAHLIKYLLSEKHEITCIRKSKDSNLNYPNIRYIDYNLNEAFDNRFLPDNIEYIIHLAATIDNSMNPLEIFRINTLSTLNLLEYAKYAHAKKFLFISTGGVYGYKQSPSSEESPYNPIGFYGLSKYQSELLVNYYKDIFQIIILRLFYPYGPNQKKGIIPQLTQKILKNEPILIYNKGNPRINPIHISDVTKTIIKCLYLESNQIINICGDEVISIKELSEILGLNIGIKPKFQYVENQSISDLIGDNRKMKFTLGIQPSISLEQGIQQFLIEEHEHNDISD